LYYSVATIMGQPRRRWDVFCCVIDNFGDAGVCWRLARQLVSEHGLEVRLFVDALAALARIAPAIDATRSDQLLDGVRVIRWAGPRGEHAIGDPGAAVIEAFGCGLPETYLAAMTGQHPQPVWINLEYLSAEAWIDGCHGLASRHPRLPLTRHFFFPGFTRSSGGLLRERDLFDRRDAFRADARAQENLWRTLGVAKPGTPTQVASLFSYSSALLASLFAAWSDGDEPILCLVPEGVAASAISAWAGGALQATRGRLTLASIPFLSQQDYDRLLWQCDLNFVRGEDSFVRAQWAGRPFIWQPYPQPENAHRLKLDAFLDRYTEGLAADGAAALRAFSSSWSNGSDAGACWTALARVRGQLSTHAQTWAGRIAALTDLAQNLVKFCVDRV
jgi:uncharacterized repeat protein (TIGR03837 family)